MIYHNALLYLSEEEKCQLNKVFKVYDTISFNFFLIVEMTIYLFL
jgi:hypothetical protein